MKIVFLFRKKAKKSANQVVEKGSNASVLNELWPKSERPQDLQCDLTVNGMAMESLQACYRMYLDKLRAEGGGGLGSGIEKDVDHPKVHFNGGNDDRKKRLLKSSFLRLPLSDESYWCEKVPLKRKPIIRALNLAHSGSSNKVSAKTIESMHDRGKPVELKNLATSSLGASTKGGFYISLFSFK